MSDQEKLHKLVVGALKSSITAHGDITKEWIGSAAKRVVAFITGDYSDEALKQACLDKLKEQFERQNKNLKNRLRRTQKFVRQLLKVGNKMKLTEQLQKCGCKASPDDFRQVVEETFNRMYPNWTDDDLLCKPTAALTFDNAIRTAVDCHELPDEVINRTLINLRKSSKSRHQRQQKNGKSS